MPTWNEIKESVEKNGNVLTTTMEQLREPHGAGKLGVNVRAEISGTLAERFHPFDCLQSNFEFELGVKAPAFCRHRFWPPRVRWILHQIHLRSWSENRGQLYSS